ncbi:hypothetical protein LTR09_005605 [Extremus antarcticus]|uniref:Uncharacterized protein n=1 Tax=Extremus antarcticus TaxID=702011 RepID=A0AAJ0DMV9_9PEZI|nr:hypothetical protein LTR09_005605 [Extremus antarcticus]
MASPTNTGFATTYIIARQLLHPSAAVGQADSTTYVTASVVETTITVTATPSGKDFQQNGMSSGQIVAAAVVPICVLSICLGACLFFSLRELRRMLGLIWPNVDFAGKPKRDTGELSEKASESKKNSKSTAGRDHQGDAEKTVGRTPGNYQKEREAGIGGGERGFPGPSRDVDEESQFSEAPRGMDRPSASGGGGYNNDRGSDAGPDHGAPAPYDDEEEAYSDGEGSLGGDPQDQFGDR